MAETTIEWADYDLAEEAGVGKGDSVYEKIGRLDALGLYPVPYVPIALGAITGPTSWDDVARRGSSALGDWVDMIPRFRDPSAVGAKSIEQSQKKSLAGRRYGIRVSLPSVRKLLETVAIIWLTGIPPSALSVDAIAAKRITDYRPVSNPTATSTTPTLAGRTPQLAFPSDRATARTGAIHTASRQTIIPGSIQTKAARRPPLAAGCAVFKPSRSDE